jgi:hypothetical protein
VTSNLCEDSAQKKNTEEAKQLFSSLTYFLAAVTGKFSLGYCTDVLPCCYSKWYQYIALYSSTFSGVTLNKLNILLSFFFLFVKALHLITAISGTCYTNVRHPGKEREGHRVPIFT